MVRCNFLDVSTFKFPPFRRGRVARDLSHPLERKNLAETAMGGKKKFVGAEKRD
jgi:hypothetical protein